MTRIPAALFWAVGMFALPITTVAGSAGSNPPSRGQASDAASQSQPYAKVHGHDHAKLCSKSKCIEYCDEREMDSQGGVLRRLRRECRKDCMRDCDLSKR
ncbi:MAG TPA: hypothetical protein VFE23_16630 [Usitatibacter sp.]|jgi:hypothetical protein|nr:hypothetical protein [Usitatibacter sp.]